jgi:hypothetical protein
MDLKKFFTIISALFLSIVIFNNRANAGPLAAGLCPQCYGFENKGNDLFIENGATPQDFETMQYFRNKATKDVKIFFPDFSAKPRFIVCKTRECDSKMGVIGAKAQTFGQSLIFISSRGWEQKFITHEISHAAFHQIAGSILSPSGIFPAWFDEGVAVIVSNDERYIRPEKIGLAACIKTDIKDLPNNRIKWGAAAGKDILVYSRAACRVEIWLDKIGGPSKFYENFKSNVANGEFKE